MYDLTNLTNATGLYDYSLAVNQMSEGWYGSLMLGAIFIILFIIFKKYEDDSKTTFLVSSFITGVISLFFYLMGFIGDIEFGFAITVIFTAMIIRSIAD